MTTKLIFGSLICMLFTTGAHSQSATFFGKSWYADLSYNYAPCILSNNEFHYYYNISSNNTYKKERYDYKYNTFTLSINHAFEDEHGIGLEINYGKSNYTALPNNGSSSYYYNDVLGTDLVNMRGLGFMPVFHLQKQGLNRPMGVSQDIGVGLTGYKLIDAVEMIPVNYYPNYTSGYDKAVSEYASNGNSVFPSGMKFKEYRIMYGLTYRKALSPSIALNFGYRFYFNYLPKKNYEKLGAYDGPINELYNNMRMDRLKTFFELKGGLTYMIR